jgi:hypothetical protein
MAAPYPGKASTFYISRGSPTPLVKQPCTQVGSTKQYYITNRANQWWDPNSSVVVYDDNTPVPGCKIDYAGGYFNLPANYTPSGTITVSASTIPMERLGGGFGWSAAKKARALDATIYSEVGSTLSAKSFIGDGLIEWTGSLKRHFYYGRASVTADPSGDDNAIVWTWKGSGSFGNDESVEYVEGGSLEVARASNTTTVTIVAGVTTAAAIKAHVESDPVLNELWKLDYVAGNDGTGVVTTFTETHCTGGRDSTQEITSVAAMILCVFYLETDTAASPRLEGVGIITNLNLDDPLEDMVNADLDFQGTGDLCYHAN